MKRVKIISIILALLVLLFTALYLNPTILNISNIRGKKEKLLEELYDSSFEIMDYDDEIFNIVILFESKNLNNKIKSIEYNKLDEEENIVLYAQKEKIAIDYKVPIEDINTNFFEYKITFEDGREIQSTLGLPKWITKTINYSGEEELLALWPATYKIECFGARGGNGYGYSAGGYGGYTSGIITITDFTIFKVNIGQAGQDGNSRRESFNGGAIGGYDTYIGTENGGSGGGATDIRLTSDIEDRIMVAGGGGRSRRMV